MTRVAILNSRQSKTPLGTDPWVRNTLEAVSFAATQGWTIQSSIGMNTWELVTWAAGQRQSQVELHLPANCAGDASGWSKLLTEFQLAESSCALHSLPHNGDLAQKSWWEERDRSIIANADILMPLSVREGGQLADLLARRRPEQRVESRFRSPYKPQPHHADAAVVDEELSAEIRAWTGDYLIHWTRSCQGPWPGESKADYYGQLCRSDSEYCRSAFATLRRILMEGRIRASGWRIAGSRTVVAFTELKPVEALPLMRWRARFARWSFEPYGIAIQKREAEQLGARPVIYLSRDEWRALSEMERTFAHRSGDQSADWPAEREWRLAGDLDLQQIDPQAIRVIVRTPEEVAQIRTETDYPVIPMTSRETVA